LVSAVAKQVTRAKTTTKILRRELSHVDANLAASFRHRDHLKRNLRRRDVELTLCEHEMREMDNMVASLRAQLQIAERGLAARDSLIGDLLRPYFVEVD
jgi:hypothetical protein